MMIFNNKLNSLRCLRLKSRLTIRIHPAWNRLNVNAGIRGWMRLRVNVWLWMWIKEKFPVESEREPKLRVSSRAQSSRHVNCQFILYFSSLQCYFKQFSTIFISIFNVKLTMNAEIEDCIRKNIAWPQLPTHIKQVSRRSTI